MVQERRQTFLVCDRCGKATIHTLLCSEESDVESNDADGYLGIEPATYNVLRCNGCTRISLYIWSAFHRPDTEFGEREYPAWGNKYRLPSAVQLAFFDAERVKHHSDGAYAIM